MNGLIIDDSDIKCFDIQVHWVAWIVDAVEMSPADKVSDVKSKCFKKPVPKSLNWRVMNTAKMLGSRKPINVNIRCISRPASMEESRKKK